MRAAIAAPAAAGTAVVAPTTPRAAVGATTGTSAVTPATVGAAVIAPTTPRAAIGATTGISIVAPATTTRATA
ncbi:Uncharacterised protein [Mycobacteroides abscessus subsp. massiliense]|nr:Uncharacterised protein [Mycobacteroides abscessus subsp. massiliense]